MPRNAHDRGYDALERSAGEEHSDWRRNPAHREGLQALAARHGMRAEFHSSGEEGTRGPSAVTFHPQTGGAGARREAQTSATRIREVSPTERHSAQAEHHSTRVHSAKTPAGRKGMAAEGRGPAKSQKAMAPVKMGPRGGAYTIGPSGSKQYVSGKGSKAKKR